MIKRGSGILMPIFSLPGKFGIGGFSKEARKFVDFLKKAGQSYWQILPLGPTSYGDSPYQSFSIFAINPYFIDPDTLVEKGLLKRSEADKLKPDFEAETVNYAWLYNTRLEGLRPAFERFKKSKTAEYECFLESNADWIYDYALFMAIKRKHNDASFDSWPKKIRKRDEAVLSELREELKDETEFFIFLQYEADSEWKSLRKYANENGIRIIGDIPIYVAYDSCDVWTTPFLFQMNRDGVPTAVAGCPPDGFSADGQLWGNPLYNWDYQKKSGYEWWRRRIEKCKELYDVIRIDHFRGFDEYFSVPYGDINARRGKWCKGPGVDLFDTLKSKLGETEIIAEDLGYITDSVKKLVSDTGFANMKVIEFAFDSRDSSGPTEYLPHNYVKNCVVYTGTHDNETLAGWLKSILPAEKKSVKQYMGMSVATDKELADGLIRLAQSSVANLCIIPIQDYLGLSNEARINRPSSLGGNWVWRLDRSMLNATVSSKIKKLTMTYGRNDA